MSGDDGHECPTCGRTDFASKQGMRQHHTMAHGESLVWVEITCDWCGDTEMVHQSRAESGAPVFCGQSCMGSWRSKNIVGEDSPTYNGGKVTVKCDYCGEPDQRYPANIKGRTFCDRECSARWKSEEKPPEEHPNWKGGDVTVECAWCGDAKEVRRYRLQTTENFFCDDDCLGQFRSKYQTDVDNPNWEGGEVPYGPGWGVAKKRRVRIRDQARCQHCGRTEPEHLDQFGSKHVVHHVVPARHFDDPHERNATGNLVTLCRGKCHHIWEQMAPLRPDSARVADD